MKLYVPTLWWSSLIQSFSIQQALRNRFGIDFLGEKSETIGMHGCDEPSQWGADEFAWAEERLRAVGVYCNAGESGLTAEFPWEPGAVSAMTGDQTSLLQMDSTITHPTAGNGLVFRLVLPLAGDEEELPAREVQGVFQPVSAIFLTQIAPITSCTIFAIWTARYGGTAFPTWTYCCVRLPSK